MIVRDFLSKYVGKYDNVAFIKTVASKDLHTPFYSPQYATTPIRLAEEWINANSLILDYIVLNDAQPPIDWLSGAPWLLDFNRGSLTNILVISPETFKLLYPGEDQRDSMIAYIDKKIIERRK